jgi:hypothetical protein
MMRTIEVDTINGAALIIRDEAAPVARTGNYEPARFNAMKHGIYGWNGKKMLTVSMPVMFLLN